MKEMILGFAVVVLLVAVVYGFKNPDIFERIQNWWNNR